MIDLWPMRSSNCDVTTKNLSVNGYCGPCHPAWWSLLRQSPQQPITDKLLIMTSRLELLIGQNEWGSWGSTRSSWSAETALPDQRSTEGLRLRPKPKVFNLRLRLRWPKVQAQIFGLRWKSIYCSFIQCTVCDHRHSLKDGFQKHIQTVHENNIPYNAHFVVTVIV